MCCLLEGGAYFKIQQKSVVLIHGQPLFKSGAYLSNYGMCLDVSTISPCRQAYASA